MSQALTDAAAAGDVAKVRERLDAGDDINDCTHGNALRFAGYHGRIEVLRLLIERGADLTDTGGDGKTAAQYARERGHIAAAELLEKAANRVRPPEENWIKMSDDAVALVGTYPALQRKLTHIFNFALRERLVITENLATKAETSPPPTRFDDMPSSALEKALGEFARLGGSADENFVLRSAAPLGKPKPGLGGKSGAA
jgi:hypothetical protein